MLHMHHSDEFSRVATGSEQQAARTMMLALFTRCTTARMPTTRKAQPRPVKERVRFPRLMWCKCRRDILQEALVSESTWDIRRS